MHVVTFYSYKGGTGRSMALVNVAVELAKSGLRVLIVDFDLEAPGLDTFNLPRPQEPPRGGVVDFVTEYLTSGQSPDASKFIYASPLNELGKLWVMPAGRSDNEYDKRVKAIDWRNLYDNRHGYILFEDLKAQWDDLFRPDYVLIDSRTGHTDVGGICTRQLPDSVVLFFLPDEQNRRGLKTVIDQIRAESKTTRRKEIKLHFVMSRVPELDDEDGILATAKAQTQDRLNYEELSGVIHHYQSLTLLKQSVFSLDRPRTRLAQEYQALAKVIRRDNLIDREVALEFLDEIAPHPRMHGILAKDLESHIERIRTKYEDDPEILTRLAGLLRRQRRFDDALALLDKAGAAGAHSAEFHLLSAELLAFAGDLRAALKEVDLLLNATDATYLEISAAARLLLQRNPESLSNISNTPAFGRLEPEAQYLIANQLLSSKEGLEVAIEILRTLVDRHEVASAVSTDLACALIGSGRFEAAIDLITNDGRRHEQELETAEAFNYAMAKWGLNSVPSSNLFERVVDLDKIDRVESANGHQCLAIALWATGNTDNALERIGEAWQQIATTPRPTFSCWSYLQLSPDRFLEDLEEIRQLLEGREIAPRFISQKAARGVEEA
jgi:MinD-like ATPase involved in chromosome partitioning or flagellar assembly